MDQISREPEALARSLARGLQNVGHPKKVHSYSAMLVLSPEHWQVFKRAGWSRSGRRDRAVRAVQATGPRADAPGVDGITEGMGPDWESGEHSKFEPGALTVAMAGSHAGLMSRHRARLGGR